MSRRVADTFDFFLSGPILPTLPVIPSDPHCLRHYSTFASRCDLPSWTHDLHQPSGSPGSRSTEQADTGHYPVGFNACCPFTDRALQDCTTTATKLGSTMVESRQCEVLAIVCTFTVVASFTVFLRVWSRCLGRNFCWDDWLILAAFVLLIADTVGTWMYIILSGTGYHIYDLPKKSIEEQLVALRWNFTVQMLYHPRTYPLVNQETSLTSLIPFQSWD